LIRASPRRARVFVQKRGGSRMQDPFAGEEGATLPNRGDRNAEDRPRSTIARMKNGTMAQAICQLATIGMAEFAGQDAERFSIHWYGICNNVPSGASDCQFGEPGHRLVRCGRGSVNRSRGLCCKRLRQNRRSQSLISSCYGLFGTRAASHCCAKACGEIRERRPSSEYRFRGAENQTWRSPKS